MVGGAEISKEPTNPLLLGRMQSAVRCRSGAEKCTAAIQYLLEVWSRSTAAALESGKLWAEDTIIWFMMARYKVTAREVETMAGDRLFTSGLRVKQV